MRLSISSFKSGFIIKTICCFFFIGSLYYGFVSLLPKGLQGANQWQTNVLKAQEYAFSSKEYPIVYVGSSMLYNVPVEKLSDENFNLAFAGGSSNSGLQLILQKEIKPKVIAVELNETILRGVDGDLIEHTRGWYKLPFGREVNRPDVVFYNLAVVLKEQIREKKPLVDKSPLNDEIDRRLKGAASSLNLEHYRRELCIIKNMLNNLQAQGIKVLLVEIPNAPELYDTIKYQTAHALEREIFPENEYQWHCVEWEEYSTIDGVHLQSASAMRYGKELFQVCRDLIK